MTTAARMLGLIIALSAPAVAGAADSLSSDWATSLKSSARLVMAPTPGASFIVGVEIKLAPHTITYWRNPGEAGAPPVFSFEKSINVGIIT